MLRKGLLVAAATLILAALWIAQCSGPTPHVGSVHVSPPAPGSDDYEVRAEIGNASSGHGQVNVIVRLRDRQTGQTYQESRKANLDAREVTHVVVRIRAPRGDYEPEVEVEYPAR